MLQPAKMIYKIQSTNKMTPSTNRGSVRSSVLLCHPVICLTDYMESPSDYSLLWRKLSMREIVDALPAQTFSSKEKRSRAKLDAAVLNLPLEQRSVLDRVARAKAYGFEHPTITDMENDTSTGIGDSTFMETVSEECRQDRICRFIDATGNNATATTTCAVCAGTFFNLEIEEVSVSDLRDKQKLQPAKPHPAQVLTEGMLLHSTPSSIHSDPNGSLIANVCTSCASDLKRNKTPALSLANVMWIGEIPLELKVLTLPERILVARFFPAAYIVKLYPKKKGARHWAPDGQHHALRGNVSTYRLNTDQIAHLANSDILPPSPSILSATVGVTFVGPKNYPEKTMPGFLRVNRERVRRALEWLKQHNPLYVDITISNERIEALPLDGIPEEIYSVVKYSDDMQMLDEEHDGYVPGDYSEDVGVSCTFPVACFGA